VVGIAVGDVAGFREWRDDEGGNSGAVTEVVQRLNVARLDALVMIEVEYWKKSQMLQYVLSGVT